MAQIYQAAEATEAFGKPSRKANEDYPVGHCMKDELEKIFTSAQNAMERDLEKTTLADVIEAVKACKDS